MNNKAILEEIEKRLAQKNKTLELLTKQKNQILGQFKDLKAALLEEIEGIDSEIISFGNIKTEIPSRKKGREMGR